MGTDNDILVTRDLLCAIIEQAAVDAVEIRSYKDKSKQEANEHHHRDAVDFFQGELYTDICDVLNLASDTIRNEILRKVEKQRQKLINLIEHETKRIPEMDVSSVRDEARDKDAYGLLLALRQMRRLRQERGGNGTEGLQPLQEVVRQEQNI